MTKTLLGPFLTVDTIEDTRAHIAALFVAPSHRDVPPIEIAGQSVPATKLIEVDDSVIWRARFSVPTDAPSVYAWNGTDYPLASHLTADMRVAFASCNGEEHGDLDRDPQERNAMWAKLCDAHRTAPFSLLLHGGDQIYADEATKGHPLSEDWPARIPKDVTPDMLEDLRRHLRSRFAERYITLLSDPHYAWLCARVPSLAQWDDHDICDGWGSLPRDVTSSAIGQTLFSVAREMALAFQHATVLGDLPDRFPARDAAHLGWRVQIGDLAILAPDLRSQRGRRQVMGPEGWRMMEDAAKNASASQTFLMSSVPLLGPRLSVLETLLLIIPAMQKYEDDLRDQWQSRAHREAWKRMLSLVSDMSSPLRSVTVLSGEIHLATRATMVLDRERVLHQLVASGIAHRPPPSIWPRVLGLLASFGESPLPRQPISIRRIPGQSTRYIAERNALILDRKDGAWQARWMFEDRGMTPALPI